MNEIQEVNLLLNEIGVEPDSWTIETGTKVIRKYGGLTNVLQAALEDKHKFSKKRTLLVSLLDEKSESKTNPDAEDLINLVHSINYKVRSDTDDDSDESYNRLYDALNIEATIKNFYSNDPEKFAMSTWVISEMGGKNFMKSINTQEINSLLRRVQSMIDKYNTRSDVSDVEQITNQSMQRLVIKR